MRLGRKIQNPNFKMSNILLSLERELNSEQLRVVREADGPCLVLAGAGSGKTRTITYRVAHLLKEGVYPSSILLLTFTNKAANEMMERVASLLGTRHSGIVGGTFHSVANRILRGSARPLGYDEKFTILDQDDSRGLIKICLKDVGVENKGKMAPSAAILQNILSFSRNSKMPLSEVVEAKYPKFYEFIPSFEDAARQYDKRKKAANSMDFDDLLVNLLEVLRNAPDIRQDLSSQFKYILVDEYQDTNPVQADIIDALGSVHKNILVVGDDAQSIYSFRAATISNILEFPQHYPGAKIFKLETNYRSTPDILEVANSIILNNTNQFSKRLKSIKKQEAKPMLAPLNSAYEEAEFVTLKILGLFENGYKPREVAVLFRASHHSQVLELELGKRGIEYEYRGGLKFFERAHIKDAVAFLRVFLNPKDFVSWLRILEMQEGIGATGAVRIAEQLRNYSDISLVIKADFGGELTPKAEVGFRNLMSIFSLLAAAEALPGALLYAVIGSSYKDYLEAEYPDAEERLADLREMAQFAGRASDLAEFLSEVSLTDAFGAPRKEAGINSKKIILSTIHQAKGLEWEAVFVIGLTDANFPNRRALLEEGGLEEERRLFYVATTRAKRLLYLTYPITSGFDSISLQSPSMFLDEISVDLLERQETASRYSEHIIEIDEDGNFKANNRKRPKSYLKNF